MIRNFRSALSVLVALAFTGAVEQDCGQQELTTCARPLKVLSNATDFHFVSRKEELDKLCPDLEKGLQCIHSYTRRCMNPSQRTHFKRLYRGTGQAIKDLCTESPYQAKFLMYAPCLQTIRPQYEKCSGNHMAAITAITNANGSSSDPNSVKTFCCSFYTYIRCSENAVREECGPDSAEFTKEFLYRVSDTLIKMHCNEYFESTSNCGRFLYNMATSPGLAPALATLLLPVVLTLAVLLTTPTNSSRIVMN